MTVSLHGGNEARLKYGVCAREAERSKIQKYKKHLEYDDDLFVPFALESGGTIGPAGLKLVDTLIGGMPDKTSDDKATAKEAFFRGLSVVAQRANADKLLAHARLMLARPGEGRSVAGRVAG